MTGHCHRRRLRQPQSTWGRFHSSSTNVPDGTNGRYDPSLSLATSRPGLDPKINRFHHPIVYHEHYSFPDWPTNHTFPMNKFEQLAHVLTTETTRLPRPLIRDMTHFYRPLDVWDMPLAWFTTTTTPTTGGGGGFPVRSDFFARFLNGRLTRDECRIIGFREQTCRPELIRRTLLEVGGTILSAQLALSYGISSNVGGGTHHAHMDMGAGYTILNDFAIASHFLFTNNTPSIRRVLVIDCDVHQGDGTAKYGQFMYPDRLFTLSLHCESNYPLGKKATSTFDIGLPDGMQDEAYMRVLQRSVSVAMERVRPDVIFYDAGVDVYEGDALGRLNLSEDGIRRRDRFVLERCVRANIPVVAVIGGGYDKDWMALANRHAIVHEECAFLWRKYKLWQRP